MRRDGTVRLAYVAAPFAARTNVDINRNVERALTICRWALSQGYAPICIHPTVQRGGYGFDGDPVAREKGLTAACALAAWVGSTDGVLLMLETDPSTVSAGVAREWAAFLDAGGKTVIRDSWFGWAGRVPEPPLP
jgi:hypothetical protein